MAKDATKKPSIRTTITAGLSPEEEIRRRAYQIYEERGREDGHDLDDWLSAEAEITGTHVKITAA